MAMHLRYYIGPYLLCGLKNNIPKLVPSGYVVLSCPKKDCINHKHSMAGSFYCNICGSKLSSVDLERHVDSIEKEDIYDQIKGNLANFLSDRTYYSKTLNKHIWHINLINVSSATEFYFVDDNNKYMPIVDGDLIERHKKAFANDFEKEIAIIKKYYGEDQVTIEWGTFPYYI